jgi:hypothetical protein
MTLDMIATKTGREQAEIFMRQQAKRIDRIIRARKGIMKKAAYNGFPRQQVITLMPTNPRCKPQQ